jgi:hypothetical protein
MEDSNSIIEPLIERIESFGQTSFELIKLKTIGKTTDLVSNLTSRLIAVFFLMICFIIASIGLALFIGNLLENMSYGFFIVAALYGIIGFVVYFMLHQKIKNVIGNSMVKQIFQ